MLDLNKALSWGQVRAIVGAARDLQVADRAKLDRAIAERVDAPGAGHADPDVVLGAVDAAVYQLTADRVERDEAHAIEASFIAVQPDVFGGSRGYWQLDAELTATVVAAIDAAADPPACRRPCRDPDCAAPDCTDAPAAPARPRLSRGQQRAEGLRRVCDAFLAGAAGGRARPTMVVHADAATLLDRRGVAELDRPLPGGPVWLSPQTARRLACNARLTAVAHSPDGTMRVGAARDVIATRLRTAVVARDGRCRFPGCAAPARWADIHHIVHRADGGATVLSNLLALCRRCHTRVHHQRWLLTLHRDGRLTVQRNPRGRTYTSLPRRLRRLKLAPADQDDPALARAG